MIDAAMVDGAALMLTPFYGARASGFWGERGTNMLDTGAPYYDVYETADGGWIAVGAIEPQFYAALLDGLGLDADALPDRDDQASWPALKERFAAVVRTRTRDEWVAACSTAPTRASRPVLTPIEAPEHPHNRGPARPSSSSAACPSPHPRRASRARPSTRPRAAAAPGRRPPTARSASWGFDADEVDGAARRRRPRLSSPTTTRRGTPTCRSPSSATSRRPRGILARLARRRMPGATDVEVGPIRGPALTGFSNETLLFDVVVDRGRRRARAPRASSLRVKPTAHTVFLESDFECAVPGARDARHAAPTCPCRSMRWFEADDALPRRAVLRDGPRRRPRARPTARRTRSAAGCLESRRPTQRRTLVEQRPRGDGRGPRGRLARARARLPRQAAVRRARVRAAAPLLRGRRSSGPTAARSRRPIAVAALDWVRAHAPADDPEITVCWGDARINNQLFGDDYDVAAVVDWEMVTLADPMMDLGLVAVPRPPLPRGHAGADAWRASRPARRWSPTTSR